MFGWFNLIVEGSSWQLVLEVISPLPVKEHAPESQTSTGSFREPVMDCDHSSLPVVFLPRVGYSYDQNTQKSAQASPPRTIGGYILPSLLTHQYARSVEHQPEPVRSQTNRNFFNLDPPSTESRCLLPSLLTHLHTGKAELQTDNSTHSADATRDHPSSFTAGIPKATLTHLH